MFDGWPADLEPEAGARIKSVGGCGVRRPGGLRVEEEPGFDFVEVTKRS